MRRHHQEVPRPTPEQIVALVQGEIDAGRHSPVLKAVCDGCGEVVNSIFYVVEATPRRRLCPDCADRMGQGPASTKRPLAVSSLLAV